MSIFGKSFSEYASFEKVILWLIAIVGLGRLAISLAGVPNSSARWLSVTAASVIGLFYASIRVHTKGFGSYKQLLPLIWIQAVLAHFIVIVGIVLSIYMEKENIYSAPEFSPQGNGRSWGHAFAHVLAGLIVVPLIGWLIGSLILFITKKVAPRNA